MEPDVVVTYHIYPEGCDDLHRFVLVSEFTDPDLEGFDGITISSQYRKDTDKPYKTRWTDSLDLNEARAFYNCLGKVIANKEALVQVEADAEVTRNPTQEVPSRQS
jgi:hypothetical protein